MEKNKAMLYTRIRPGDIGRYVIVPGSVERARLIAAHFDHAEELVQHREFLTFVGELDGERVSVTSTGIGTPSTAIAVEECAYCGADTFLRIGSCASASPLSRKGDVLIPRGSVRMEGTADHLLPVEFPAVPDFEMFKALTDAAEKFGYRYNTGVTIEKDSFYTEASPETKPVYPLLKYQWEAYIASGATQTSMESSLLFILGAYRRLRTATVQICATNFNDYSNDDADYPRDWEQRAIEVGIEGLRLLIRRDRERAEK